MTFAAKSHDAFETAQRIKEQIQEHLEAADLLQEKLVAAEREAERQLLMANALSLLREISTRNLSEGQRMRHRGVCEALAKHVRAS